MVACQQMAVTWVQSRFCLYTARLEEEELVKALLKPQKPFKLSVWFLTLAVCSLATSLPHLPWTQAPSHLGLATAEALAARAKTTY